MASAAVPRPDTRSAGRSKVACGRSVDYLVDPSATNTGLLGVWVGTWNNPGRLCGALIVQSIDRAGTVDLIYIYGPSRPARGLPWKQQHQVGVLRAGILSFQDDQKSSFTFSPGGPLGTPESLNASFVSHTGHLTGTFERVR